MKQNRKPLQIKKNKIWIHKPLKTTIKIVNINALAAGGGGLGLVK